MSPKSKILIVDDEAVITLELETTLSAMGYNVLGTAGSGAEAVAMAKRLKPDLVLMDIMMPGELDGIAAAAEIKSATDISVIFLTAYSGDQEIERAKQVEPLGYLVKPFRNDQVKAAIEIALNKKKMETQFKEHQRLTRLLLDSLPHPAMLINRDRIILAANRMARESGTAIDDYCWKSFGKCAHIPEGEKQYLANNPGCRPPKGIKCTFCLADEAMADGQTSNNPEVAAFDRIWDTYWVPIDDRTYLHYAIDITGRKQMEARLRDSNEILETAVTQRTDELKQLSAQLLDVQETERKRIASDLHDSIGQILAAIKFGVENAIHDIQETQITADLSTLKALLPVAKQACDEVRRLHSDLRPPLLDDMGIVATITWLCREMQTICRGIHIEKCVDISEKMVPPELKIVIFRILQEGLNNAVKHAHPERVDVALRVHDRQIELVIQDDGQGFDTRKKQRPQNFKSGFGLRSMKERTKLSGGSFSITSKPGEGTTLRAAWPAALKA